MQRHHIWPYLVNFPSHFLSLAPLPPIPDARIPQWTLPWIDVKVSRARNNLHQIKIIGFFCLKLLFRGWYLLKAMIYLSHNICILLSREPESEKPCQRVSNADRKVFVNPESFCDMLIIGWRIWKCPDAKQNIQKKSARMIWKVSGQSKKCPNNLGNVSRWSGKFPDNLKSVQII